jgi:hypothetical protein
LAKCASEARTRTDRGKLFWDALKPKLTQIKLMLTLLRCLDDAGNPGVKHFVGFRYIATLGTIVFMSCNAEYVLY